MNELQLTTLLKAEFRRRVFEESYTRIHKCLDILTINEIWQRPNENSNSVGNLILHLEGNVRQWIIAGLGKQNDVRLRQSEFNQRDQIPKKQLLSKLTKLEEDVTSVIEDLTPAQLVNHHKVQGFDETGISILIHVIEHFSYQVGQITYFVKAIKDLDLKYYGEIDLDQ